MGAVYRGTDTNLKRQVAIKILPPAVAADADRLARFCPRDGTGRGRRPLAAHRARGNPIDEALPIAMQIAEALEAAHAQGIIHRDLKPAFPAEVSESREGETDPVPVAG